ncbi:Nucleolar MIF4G domain-containing protein 1 homolog [Eumeta japonica]|uniref:Nucleolar MIF4G domain-containing protein 1 homolog n=1 Tax=Eumeta variegata TaxID=151549 RepID=A0A4C1TC80_EUMVA|nr:Nucleolar MIF4G domain-containing protein 1 homolog [Eumeta japonica]
MANLKKRKFKTAPIKKLSRKESRKQKALEKKQHKRLFFSSKTEEEKEKQALKDKRKEALKKQTKNLVGVDEEQDEEKFNAIFGSGEESDGSDLECEDESDLDKDKDFDDIHLEESEENVEEEELKEDIYGRKRDKLGNIIREGVAEGSQRYIPPHQRAMLSASTDNKQAEILERLRKQCKGLLNRLSEANLHKISNGIEELYMKTHDII